MECEASLTVIAFVRKYKKLSGLLALVCFIAGAEIWEISARLRGQFVARFDLARRHYRVLTLGLPARWRPEHTRLLRQRYGIEEQAVAGCMVSESLGAYVAWYNTLSMDAAKRKLGHDVFKETVADAIKSMGARPAAAIH
jgi:hypothetical protein